MLNPDSAGAHYGLGGVLENRGELIEAAAAYRRAIALKPNFAVAYNGLGTTLKHLGDDTRTTALRRVRSGVAEVPSLFIPPNLGGALLTILLAGARSTVWSIVEMRHRRSHVFTPAAIQLVHGLADQGKTASEIADAIGSTAASVRARCCQLKIKLARAANGGVPGTQQGLVQEQKLIVRMQPKAYAALEGQAVHMQKSTDELAGMLLEAIVGRESYDAVLDNGD